MIIRTSENAGATNTGVLGSKPLNLDSTGGFASDVTHNCIARQPCLEVCQHCGLLRPIKEWFFFTYMENRPRAGFAPLCAACNQVERERIERNRRRRR